jgi:serine phosphatase RsbU (regulator of sigma subunit)/anti-sigma regulatory factor (Ser/Thr protein kinase)
MADPTSTTPSEEALTQDLRRLRRPLLAGAIATLAILISLVLVLFWRQYQDAKGEAAGELRSRAILAAAVFDTYFTGQLSSLSAIAASPTVTAGDIDAMTNYFAHFRNPRTSTFTAGVGWIDLDGFQRATSDPQGPIKVSLRDRTYFSKVVSTGKPFISEAIVARNTKRRLVVMAVPTRDVTGRVTGVLAGGIVLTQSASNSRASDLGYTGLEVIDREGQQITRRDLAKSRNAALVVRIRKEREGVLVDTRGLAGSDGRVVAYGFSAAPGWTTVIDQPTSMVFAGARTTLLREGLLLAAVALTALVLIAWGILRTRRELRAGRARVARWVELTRALNDAVDAGQIQAILASSLSDEFPGGLAAVVCGSEGETGRRTTIRTGRDSPLRLVDDHDAPWVDDILAQELPLNLQTQLELMPGSPDSASTTARSVYAFSLSEGGSIVDAAALCFGSNDALATDELALFQAYTEQAAQALSRVRRHEQEHDVAVILQQSLLPIQLPDADGVEVGAYYRSGVPNTSVGGDWYDMVCRPDGILHFTVGDVAGRGIDAAVAMGQLRSAFRAYALDYASPEEVIRRVNRHVAPDGMATMVCVTYDTYTGELTYASAGHVPPLLLDSHTGSLERLHVGHGAPLGWLGLNSPEEAVAHVSVGAVLALYTDGLVERRGSDLDLRIATLGAAILEEAKDGAAGIAERVVDRMVETQSEDDIALLIVHFHETPSLLHLELPSDGRLLRDVRRRVEVWLGHRGVEESARAAALLALHEACANVIEHAYGDSSGTLLIEAVHGGDTLSIRVTDHGTWREPVDGTDRGRGVMLMRGLMDSATIVQHAEGTDVLMELRV